jgi:AcrR family transcriptional regulator
MARPREFDLEVVLAEARILFAKKGYHGTSIDDLVRATGLQRGSIYKAFGSKRNLFEATLREMLSSFTPSSENLDFVTVAIKELAPDDKVIRNHCKSIIGSEKKKFAEILGNNLLVKLKESQNG